MQPTDSPAGLPPLLRVPPCKALHPSLAAYISRLHRTFSLLADVATLYQVVTDLTPCAHVHENACITISMHDTSQGEVAVAGALVPPVMVLH